MREGQMRRAPGRPIRRWLQAVRLLALVLALQSATTTAAPAVQAAGSRTLDGAGPGAVQSVAQQAGCSPRPRVVMNVTRAGEGRLQVSISTSPLTSGQANLLRSITFT